MSAQPVEPRLKESFMKVGGAVIFQNPMNERSDYDVYQDDLKFGDLYEPLGFDSIWSVEHHFDDYTMCPDVLQFLTYYAGRTKNIQLGSMVVVLPWHDPIRVAEQVSVVDHMSNGRMVLDSGADWRESSTTASASTWASRASVLLNTPR